MSEQAPERRLKRMAIVIVAVFAVLVGRLWFLQVVKSEAYDQLALVNRLRKIPVRAPRGAILDRHGESLATNRLSFTVSVVPSGFSDPQGKVVATLSNILKMDPEEIRAAIAKGGDYPYEPIRIKRDVPIEQVVAVEEARNRLPGVLVEEEWVREYPHGDLAGHVIGYLGLASRDDLQRGYRPSDLVGKTGIEVAFERFLKGSEGFRYVEVNALSRPIRALETELPKPGMDVRLTLDLRVQRIAEEALRDGLEALRESSEAGLAGAGAAVALDPKTGEILALATHPAIDVAKLTAQGNAAYVASLNSDPRGPWLNRAVRAFPPGSIFKVITGIAALESGAIAPDTVYNATGHHKHGRRDWTIHQGLPPAGPVTIVEAMGRSTNDFFWEIALRPETGGIRGIAAWAARFGLGEPTGGLLLEPGEMQGLVPTPEWKMQTHNEAWYEADTMNVAIGQGFLTTTPVQMAQVYAAVANRGVLRTPYLVKDVRSPEDGIAVDLNSQRESVIQAKPSTWDALIDGLRHGTQWQRGTAYRVFGDAPYDPAGKTGSAQTGSAAHGWFAGFAPADDPQIVVVVFAEYGESGAETSTIARAIMDGFFALQEDS